MKKAAIIIILIALAIGGWLYFIKGYVGVRKGHAVPEDLIYKADIPGFKNIRLIEDPMKLKDTDLRTVIDNSGLTKAQFPNREINVLAISGGGANGAYGAGILCGWSETGKRPEFDIVTGVSTGALTAPAAFLGPSYDKIIRDIYTNVSGSDIAKQSLIEFLFGDRPSFLDTQPLRAVLKRAVTREVVEAVAREHKKAAACI